MVTVNFNQFTHLEKVKNGKTITKATVFFFFVFFLLVLKLKGEELWR